jgi:RNA polymerase sigma factor (sigma-70 family)
MNKNDNTLYDVNRFIEIISYRIARKFNLDQYDTRQDCWVSYLENKHRLDMNHYGWKRYIIKCFYTYVILKFKKTLSCTELTDDYEEYDVDYESLYEKWSLIKCQKKLIQDLLNSITNKQRNVLSLYYGLDNKNKLKLSEIAKAIGCTRDNVKKRKRMALKKLRENNSSESIQEYLWEN